MEPADLVSQLGDGFGFHRKRAVDMIPTNRNHRRLVNLGLARFVLGLVTFVFPE